MVETYKGCMLETYDYEDRYLNEPVLLWCSKREAIEQLYEWTVKRRDNQSPAMECWRESEDTMRKRKLSANDRRKLKLVRYDKIKTVNIDISDLAEQRQGEAIVKHSRLVIHAPRLNFTYRIDGYVISSGKKHRTIG